MPLDSYDHLQESIATWLNRDDLTALIPDFITMAEARLNEILRLSPQEAIATLQGEIITLPPAVLIDEATAGTLTDEDTGAILIDEAGSTTSITLPNDFLEIRFVYANTSPRQPLRLAPPGWSFDAYDTNSGWPDVYSILLQTMTVYPATEASVTIVYYTRIPALGEGRQTNWLLRDHPQIYLYASLLEAAPVLADDNRVPLWKAALDEAVALAVEADRRLRWGNAAIRLTGPTP